MQLRHHPFLRRFAPDRERTGFPALPTVMRETQECEGLRLSLRWAIRIVGSSCMVPVSDAPGAPGKLSDRGVPRVLEVFVDAGF